MNEEYNNELNELEAEHNALINEELEERIKLEKNLNTLAYFILVLLVGLIILIGLKLLVAFGILSLVL